MNSVVANGWDIQFVRIMRRFGMTEMIENRMVVDSEWEELEYGIPNKDRIEKQRRSYEEEEYGWRLENEYIV